MEDLKLKYVEIVFDKEKPQSVGTRINILGKIDSEIDNLEYKFIVGKGGIWNTIQEFSEKNKCTWNPKSEGEYIVMVQAREKNGKKSLDYLAKEDYSIVKGEINNTMHEEVSVRKVVNEEDAKIDYNTTVNGIESNTIYSNKENCSATELDFKEIVNNVDEKVVFLEASEISKDEKMALIGKGEQNAEVALCEDSERKISKETSAISQIEIQDNQIKQSEQKCLTEIQSGKLNEVSKKRNKLIDKVICDKNEIVVGEKCSIKVKTIENDIYLYRFYMKKYKEWNIVRDYDADNILNYTANQAGLKEFLIQCKRMESIDSFDDYRTININVKESSKVEITNFKCLSKNLIVGQNLKFLVETRIDEESIAKEKIILLYKFCKICKDGKCICIQDYSTKSTVCYEEEQQGTYRLLCLVKRILSNKEYDDRALLVYNVKPYRNIKINSFVADLNSPQASETQIGFTSEVKGGNNLLYRYKVNGPIKQDTGFVKENGFKWNTIEPGEYEIILYVKDEKYSGDYEDTKKIAFTIEKRSKKPVKILDVVVDKEKKIITGEPVNIMVNAEGGTRLQYSFIVKKDNKKIEVINYNKSNWINFIPEQAGEYEVEIMIKDKYSQNPYDANTFVYLKAMEYLPGEIDYIIMPYKETHLIGETVEFECIIQNTQQILVKYETKINGHSVEQTDFSKNKKLRFMPKIAGKYTIEVYAKNIKCMGEYDSKKQVNLYVSEASPVINTKIIANKTEGKVNEEFAIEAISRGGKEVCYEFYLMENNEWKKVQEYSRKHYYSFIPFIPGKYKILALAKSYYKKVNYEDYAEIAFEIKDI